MKTAEEIYLIHFSIFSQEERDSKTLANIAIEAIKEAQKEAVQYALTRAANAKLRVGVVEYKEFNNSQKQSILSLEAEILNEIK